MLAAFVPTLGYSHVVALAVRVRGGHVANDGHVVRRWALVGRGIAYKALVDVAYDLDQGRLQQLCTDWHIETVPLYMVLPHRRQLTPALRSLRKFMQQQCARLILAIVDNKSKQEATRSRPSTDAND
jgi:DNA-binding transcriptional LysR family regulator